MGGTAPERGGGLSQISRTSAVRSLVCSALSPKSSLASSLGWRSVASSLGDPPVYRSSLPPSFCVYRTASENLTAVLFSPLWLAPDPDLLLSTKCPDRPTRPTSSDERAQTGPNSEDRSLHYLQLPWSDFFLYQLSESSKCLKRHCFRNLELLPSVLCCGAFVSLLRYL